MDNATSTRKLIGYVLLDLRTAQPANKVHMYIKYINGKKLKGTYRDCRKSTVNKLGC